MGDQDVQLESIRTRLLECPGIDDLAIVSYRDSDATVGMVAYVVPALDEAAVDNELKDTWVQIYRELALDSDKSPNFDTSGWNSSFTGLPYPDVDMEEYVATTADLMREDSPHTVLDVGCGTGMPLYRVAPNCQRYVGLDQSGETIKNLRNGVDEANLTQVELRVGEALDVCQFVGADFDLVACNSVSQHFPSLDYLAQFLNGALQAVNDGGRVIIGDVRDFSLEAEFHSAVVLAQAHRATPTNVLASRVDRRRVQARELMVDPRWFATLLGDVPDVTVEVRPRRGYCHNETTTFHYDVIVRKTGDAEFVKVDRWLNWRKDGVSLSKLSEMMRLGVADFGVRGLPNARVQASIAMTTRIFGENFYGSGTVLSDHLDGSALGIELEEVIKLASQYGYDCHTSRINAYVAGAFDIALLRSSGKPALAKKQIPLFVDPNRLSLLDNPSSDPRRYHMLTIARSSLIPALRRYATSFMQESERPTAYIVIPQVPRRDGELDRSALPKPQVGRPKAVRLKPEWWIPGDGQFS